MSQVHCLFVCTENRLRSATAEQMFIDSAHVIAIGCGTNRDAETPISGDLVEWADVVFVMEEMHRRKVQQKFAGLLRDKRIVNLAIADRFAFMQPELVELLDRKVRQTLGL